MKWWKLLAVVVVTVWAVVLTLPDGNLHIVFCDVGQGDAILTYRGSVQMLVDGGPPGKRAVDCLARYMPFWDRKIEMVVLTHPDADHVGGLPAVWDRYIVLHFVSVPVGKDTDIYRDLMARLATANTVVSNEYAGDAIKVAGG